MTVKDTTKCFLVTRSDGLGARLQALLNAIVLAKHFNVEFRFLWNAKACDMHAVAGRHDTFSSSFLRKHHLKKHERADYTPLGNGQRTLEEIGALLAQARGGIIVDYFSLDEIIAPLEWRDLGKRYKQAFQKLDFAAPVAAVVAEARRIELPANPVAIHLRAGDIVYGNFRFQKHFNRKVLPYSIAKRAISKLLDHGEHPILFGQDAVTCKLLAKRFGLRLGSEYLPLPATASNLQRALLDITLMSRCNQILAGDSAFATLAGLAANVSVTPPRSFWSDKQIVETIGKDKELEDEHSELPALQRSFCFFSAVHAGEKLLSVSRKIDLLEKAVRYDPTNVFYSVFKASLHVSQGNADLAEQELLQSIERTAEPERPLCDTTLFQILSRKTNPRGGLVLKSYVDQLGKSDLTQYPATRFIRTVISAIEGEHREPPGMDGDGADLLRRPVSLEQLIRSPAPPPQPTPSNLSTHQAARPERESNGGVIGRCRRIWQLVRQSL